MRRFWGVLRVVVVFAFLMLTAYAGIVDGSRGLRSASTPGERVVSATQLLFSACAVAALVAMFARRSWVFPFLVAWGIVLTATGAMASVVYGGTTILIGAIAGASVAAVAGLILWAWQSGHSRPPSS